MKNFTLAIAAFMGQVKAQKGDTDTSGVYTKSSTEVMEEFTKWVSTEGRNYKSRTEFDRRKGLWQKTDQAILEQNLKSAQSGRKDALKLAHNKFSDYDEEEKQAMMNVKMRPTQVLEHRRNAMGRPKDAKGQREAEEEEEAQHKDGRKLCDYEEIDWIKAGKVSTVKDQGGCGSCYAFDTITVLESAIAIETDSSPIHLSEQQIVDCAREGYWIFGCNGGQPSDVFFYA